MEMEAETDHSGAADPGGSFSAGQIWRYCRVFLKFCLASLSAALLDIGLFALLYYVCFRNISPWEIRGISIDIRILAAQTAARAASSAWNFIVNRYLVFSRSGEGRAPLLQELTKYYMLAVLVLAAASGATYFLSKMIPESMVAAAKTGVDIILFVIVYGIQKRFVFKDRKK